MKKIGKYQLFINVEVFLEVNFINFPRKICFFIHFFFANYDFFEVRFCKLMQVKSGIVFFRNKRIIKLHLW